MDLGDIPTWLQAVATLFALAFAATASVVASRTFKIESERDRVNTEARRAQEASARKAQAATVSAWWGTNRFDDRIGVLVRNASDAPVYQVFVTVLDADGRVETAKVHFPVLPPHAEAEFLPVSLPDEADAHRVKLTFTDASGVRWIRSEHGQLMELAPNVRIQIDPSRALVLEAFGADFLATYGVTVTNETDRAGYPQGRFVAESRTADVTDAIVCPHDWIGSLVHQSVIEPTMLCAAHRAVFPQWVLSSLTFEGRLYGVPTTTDTVALIRNTSLAPDVPESFEDMVLVGEALREAGRVSDVFAVRVGYGGDPFQLWPVFSSAGGWLFGRTADGGWDADDVGIATPESIAAFERLRTLGEAGAGFLRRSMDRAEAVGLFATGNCAFLLSTADGLRDARAAGVPLAVSAVPPFADGSPAVSFSLVHGLMMTRQGVNKAIAHDLFADYLTKSSVMTALSNGVVSPVGLLDVTDQDPAIVCYQQLCTDGMPMPSFRQMEEVWRILGRAQVAVISGAPAEATALDAASELRRCLRSDRDGWDLWGGQEMCIPNSPSLRI